MPENPNFGGVNRHFTAKHAKYWNVRIIVATASIISKFCTVIETTKYSPWVVQICQKQIQRWQTATILKKKQKIAICLEWKDQFRQNVAWWQYVGFQYWTPIVYILFYKFFTRGLLCFFPYDICFVCILNDWHWACLRHNQLIDGSICYC